jgi:hypothetical protein
MPLRLSRLRLNLMGKTRFRYIVIEEGTDQEKYLEVGKSIL